MRKFKVITDLLELFHKGDIFKECHSDYSNGSYVLEKDMIENSPMIFEEFFENPYEILEEDIKGNIHSIKRISDGQVFKIGDRFCDKNSPDDIWKIHVFSYGYGKLLISEKFEEHDFPLLFKFENRLENLKIITANSDMYSKEEVEEIILTFERTLESFKNEIAELYEKHCENYGNKISKLTK